MKTARLRQVRTLFAHPDVPVHIVRHNMRAWVRSVRMLGAKWHLYHYTPHKVTK